MGLRNDLDSVREELKELDGIDRKPSGGIRSFGSRIGNAE